MKSIYEKVLREQFQLLHPKLQEKFSLNSTDQRAIISTGVMKEIKGGFLLLRQLFHFGTKKRIVFPERGHDIPFVLENYAYQDSFGRECIVWARSFHFPKKIRHFDATMIYSERKQGIVDYFGTHHDFVSDLDFEVMKNGGLKIVSTNQRVIFNKWTLHLPPFLRGRAVIREWYDDRKETFFIHVKVINSLVGILFEYEGSFDAKYVNMKNKDIPVHIKPIREQIRE